MTITTQYQLPQRIILSGQYCRLEPVDIINHGTDLWRVLQGQNEVWKYLLDGPFDDEKSFLDWLGLCKNNQNRIYFAVIDLKSNQALGVLSLIDANKTHATVEAGGIVYSPALQKTTAATEAIYLLAKYVFDILSYRRFCWKCNNKNKASKKAALRFGFVFEGLFRQHMIVKKQNRDTAYFSILDNEWPSRKLSFEKWLDPKNFDESGKQKEKLR
jgi:RimJ/RimL family protein N-acetyltransferase